MCKVISVCNQKGGTAKTTTAVNLGIGLSREGHKVLLVDSDPQGSMTISLGYREPDNLECTLATLLSEIMDEKEPSVSDAIIHQEEGVDLIPANIELSALEVNLVNAMSREVMLRSLIEIIKNDYDYSYIIIDCMRGKRSRGRSPYSRLRFRRSSIEGQYNSTLPQASQGCSRWET